MKRLRIVFSIGFLLIVHIAFAATSTGSKLVLNRAWVEKYKDRATISGQINVDHAGAVKTPSASNPSNDGDIHAASRSQAVGLPMVAEIMNAKDVPDAVKKVKGTEGSSAAFTGVWRLWFEHSPSGQTQTQNLDSLGNAGKNTNPAHCFEVHPLTEFAKIKLQKTFRTVPGYKPKKAADAFARYEKLKISLSANSQTVSLTSKMIGFNYVEFKLRLQQKAVALPGKDGMQAKVDIFALDAADDDPPLATDVRAVFVQDTDPATEVAKLGGGAEMVVWGIPRLNLNAVSTFLKAGGASATNRKLTYEMVIVAVESTGDEEGASSSPPPSRGSAPSKPGKNKKK